MYFLINLSTDEMRCYQTHKTACRKAINLLGASVRPGQNPVSLLHNQEGYGKRIIIKNLSHILRDVSRLMETENITGAMELNNRIRESISGCYERKRAKAESVY